jgi:hypothetical protein
MGPRRGDVEYAGFYVAEDDNRSADGHEYCCSGEMSKRQPPLHRRFQDRGSA